MRTLLSLILLPILTLNGVAQDAPPPPPPSGSDDNELRGGSDTVDLSNIPVPEADRQEREPELTAAERAAGVLMVAVAPIGYTPPPIIYIDKSGMPRERYRNPLEYAPAVYHVATSKGTIRIMAGQNRIGPFTKIPRRSALSLAYEIPADPSSSDAPIDKDDSRQRKIGTLPVGPETTHLVAVLWKPPSAKLWSKPVLKVIDVSPGTLKESEAVIMNLTSSELALRIGKNSRQCAQGFAGTVSLASSRPGGSVPIVVTAERKGHTEELIQTYLRPHSNQRTFLLAWQTPPSKARPTGVEFVSLQKELPPLEPFPAPRKKELR